LCIGALTLCNKPCKNVPVNVAARAIQRTLLKLAVVSTHCHTLTASNEHAWKHVPRYLRSGKLVQILR